MAVEKHGREWKCFLRTAEGGDWGSPLVVYQKVGLLAQRLSIVKPLVCQLFLLGKSMGEGGLSGQFKRSLIILTGKVGNLIRGFVPKVGVPG